MKIFSWTLFSDIIILGDKNKTIINGILLPKLFWPTVRKNCSSDIENTFEIGGWRPRIWNFFEITWTIYSHSVGQNNFGNKIRFFYEICV